MKHEICAFTICAGRHSTISPAEAAQVLGLSRPVVYTLTLHKALGAAVKQGVIPANPCDAAELPKAKQREITPLTDQEIPLFLAAIEESPMRNAYDLCLFAGLRKGECLGLSWKQVDFEQGRITINQQLQRETGKGYYIAPTTKSGKPRTIKPPPGCRATTPALLKGKIYKG